MYNPNGAGASYNPIPAGYNPIPQQPAPMPPPMPAPPQPRRTGKKWLLVVAVIVGAMFSGLYVLGLVVGAQGPTEAEQKFVSDVRGNWPTNAQPYTDKALIKAGDRVCLFDTWGGASRADFNEMLGKMRDIDQIKDDTLRHGIFSVARGNGGLCS
jgi:hypothetical protein